MSSTLTNNQWYELRNLILDAVNDKKLSRLSFSGCEEIVTLVEEHLKAHQDAPINAAAQKVAVLCPGISKKIANEQYWLVLEKS